MKVLVHVGDRPGLGWHKHGFTERWLWVLVETRICPVLLRKQRWLEVATGRTRHDRPDWELPWARFGLDVVFLAVAQWVLSGRGLHAVDWPWTPDSPSRRTAQRWLDRLRTDALRWQHAIRAALIDRLAPRPLEEFLPTGGIPPPEGRQPSRQSAAVSQLQRGLWLLREAQARLEGIPARTLLVEARRRLGRTSSSTP